MDAGSPLYARYQRYNPFRPVNWRWLHACALAAADHRLRAERDHPDAVAAARYLRRQAICRTDQDLTCLEQKYPGLTGACRLAEGESELRWEAQARILARQDNAAIAAASGLSAETVHWFESLFFSVRNDLDARDWIVREAIGPWLPVGSEPADTGRLWAHFAYHGGPLVLEIVMAVMRGRAIPAWVAEKASGNPRRYEARLRLSARMAILTHSMTTPAEVRALRRLHRELLRLDGVRHDRGEPAKLQLKLGWLAKACAASTPAKQLPIEPHSASTMPAASASVDPDVRQMIDALL